MKTKIIYPLLLCTILFALSSCGKIKKQVTLMLKDQQICSVAGVMAAGMDCAHTVTGQTYEKDLQETMKFLEPSLEENRAGAICMSAEHFNQMKTSLDIICASIGKHCTVEIKEQLKKSTETVKSLEEKSKSKKKDKKDKKEKEKNGKN